jgi:thiosulfate dehydrogenase [quinone] large subunit
VIAVRLSDHRVVAYRAGCTHAQCIVSFDPGRGLITCPCHGAEFDPGHGAAVVSGPALDLCRRCP